MVVIINIVITTDLYTRKWLKWQFSHYIYFTIKEKALKRE